MAPSPPPRCLAVLFDGRRLGVGAEQADVAGQALRSGPWHTQWTPLSHPAKRTDTTPRRKRTSESWCRAGRCSDSTVRPSATAMTRLDPRKNLAPRGRSAPPRSDLRLVTRLRPQSERVPAVLPLGADLLEVRIAHVLHGEQVRVRVLFDRLADLTRSHAPPHAPPHASAPVSGPVSGRVRCALSSDAERTRTSSMSSSFSARVRFSVFVSETGIANHVPPALPPPSVVRREERGEAGRGRGKGARREGGGARGAGGRTDLTPLGLRHRRRQQTPRGGYLVDVCCAGGRGRGRGRGQGRGRRL